MAVKFANRIGSESCYHEYRLVEDASDKLRYSYTMECRKCHSINRYHGDMHPNPATGEFTANTMRGQKRGPKPRGVPRPSGVTGGERMLQRSLA